MAVDKWYVADKLIKNGGSFEKGLGEALMSADLSNARKIKNAFPEIYNRWETVVETELKDKKKKFKN